MVMVQRHPDPTPTSGPNAANPAALSANSGGLGGLGGRLNLLLSYAGWEPDPWIDRLPRLLEPMGILSHRVESGRQASNVIQSVRIHMAVVDLALPLDQSQGATPQPPEFAEGGPRLLELLARLETPPPVVAVKRSRTQRDDSRDISAALKLGAFAIIDRPRDATDLDLMLEVLRRCLARHYQGKWPGMT
ncbi:MAG: hypothetical protein U0640_14215 [Phycisphaerales bacterium]